MSGIPMERMTPEDIARLTLRYTNRDGSAEVLCSKAWAHISLQDGDITRLTARVAELEKGLEWYADKDNYKRRSYPNEDRFYPALIEYDEGEKARAALSQPTPAAFEDRLHPWNPSVSPPEKGE